MHARSNGLTFVCSRSQFARRLPRFSRLFEFPLSLPVRVLGNGREFFPHFPVSAVGRACPPPPAGSVGHGTLHVLIIYIYECIYVIKFILIKNPVRIDATSYTYYNAYTYTHVVYVQVNSLINLNEAAVKSLSVLRASPRSLLLRTLKYNAHANVSRFSYTSLTTS